MQCCCNDHLQVEDRHDVQSQMSKIAMRAATQKRYTGEQERVARMKDCSTSEHFSCLTFRTLSSLHSLRAHTLLAQSPELNLWFMILLNSVVLVTHPCIACSNVLNKARRISAFEQTLFFRNIFSKSSSQLAMLYIELVNELFLYGNSFLKVNYSSHPHTRNWDMSLIEVRMWLQKGGIITVTRLDLMTRPQV